MLKLILFLLIVTNIGIFAQNVDNNNIENEDEPEIEVVSDFDLGDLTDPNHLYFEDDDRISEDVKIVPIIVHHAGRAPCLGCPFEIDSGHEKVQELAQYAFDQYVANNDRDDDELMKILVKVNKAEKQVVAGIKYVIEAELGWSNCSKGQYRQEPQFCTLDSNKSTFNCNFHIIEKVWENSRSVVLADCQNDADAELVEYDSSMDDPLTFDLNPSSDEDILDEIQTSDTDEETPSVQLHRSKRDAHPAQASETSEDHEKLLDIAKFAVKQLDEVDADENARFLVNLISTSKKQTMSGWLYHMKIRIAQTTCLEKVENTLEECRNKLVLPFERCEIRVLLQPWQTVIKKLVQSQCLRENYRTSKKLAKDLFFTIEKNQRRNTKDIIGGPTEIDPESTDISELIEFAVGSLDQASNALQAQKLVRVVYAERKLVSGISTKMILELGFTNCRKAPQLDKSTCEIDDQREHQYCTVTVLEKPWLKWKRMTAFKCGKKEELLQLRKKRENSSDEEELGNIDADAIEFDHFIETFGKEYTDEEYPIRLKIFKDNMEKVRLLQRTEQGSGIYGATEFADLTEEEFTERHLGLRMDLKQKSKRKKAKIPVIRNLPDEFDWRKFNAVTPVKNQGMCGSCWAFSVTGNIEGAFSIKHGNLVSFSEQELVDCDKLDEGCNGGLPENAYKAIQKLGGLEQEKDYPYDGKNEKCHFNSTLTKAKVNGFVEVSKNETEMATWLVKNGPLSIGINANAMQFYFGGVSHPWKFLCSPKSLDHGVLIVGYGVHTSSIRHKTLPFWTVKNSWGTSWGEKGYYRIYRGDGSCGVNQMVTSASVL